MSEDTALHDALQLTSSKTKLEPVNLIESEEVDSTNRLNLYEKKR